MSPTEIQEISLFKVDKSVSEEASGGSEGSRETQYGQAGTLFFAEGSSTSSVSIMHSVCLLRLVRE